MPVCDLGINGDCIHYEVALEKIGQALQPWMEQLRLERGKALSIQATSTTARHS